MWQRQVVQVAGLLEQTGGLIRLAGNVAAFVSSNYGNDGQMAFTLLFPPSAAHQIIGVYCDDPRLAHGAWQSVVTEHLKHCGSGVITIGLSRLVQEDMSWLQKPWLAVGFTMAFVELLATAGDRYPLTWCQYEQLLVDAWQTMSARQKATMRQKAAKSSIIRQLYGQEVA
jgi:hypothetical protein